MKPKPTHNIVIIGASSGIGREVARRFASMGWHVGAAARRVGPLAALEGEYPPGSVTTAEIDVTRDDAGDRLISLCDEIDADIVLMAAGIGYQNPTADTATDIATVKTDVEGFVRIVGTAYKYIAGRDTGGRIAAITSVASTKGLGIAAAYSASKRFDVNYLDALDQLAHMQGMPVRFTDIRPGFTDTALLDTASHHYPMLMRPDKVADAIVRAIVRGRRVATIDARWRIVTALWRLIPPSLWRRLTIVK